jgi:hypothetical protein
MPCAGLRTPCAIALVSILAVPAGADGRFRPDGPQLVEPIPGVRSSVAVDDSSNFVLVWGEERLELGYRIFAHRFDAHSAPRSRPILVAEAQPGDALADWPLVSSSASGAFTVVWSVSWGWQYWIYYAAYGPEGQLLGRGTVAYVELLPYTPIGFALAGDRQGNFVVAWRDRGSDGLRIHARLFDAAGVPRGPAFRVDQGGGDASRPLAAADGAGNVTIAWQRDAAGARVGLARRFDAAGMPLGPAFELAEPIASMCSSDSGDLTAVWTAPGPARSGVEQTLDVYARRYASDGSPRGEAVRVSDTPTPWFEPPAVACSGSGAFVVTWLAVPDAGLARVDARRFTSDGRPDSPEFRVNNKLDSRPGRPNVAGSARGDFAVTWCDFPDWQGRPMAQHFRVWPPPVVKGDFDRDGHADLVLRRLQDGRARIWYMREAVRGSNALVWPPTPDWAWTLAAVDDFDADGVPDLVFRANDSGAVVVWLLGGRDGAVCIGSGSLSGAPLPSGEWDIAASADFDRDGRADLLWRNRLTHKLAVWLLDGTVWRATIVPHPDAAADADWQVVAAGDFNGDTTVDLLWYNRVSGRVVQWLLDAALVRVEGRFIDPAQAGDRNWEVVAAGEYGFGPNGQAGTHDLVWRNASSGRLVVWFMDCAGSRTGGAFTTPQAPADPLAWAVAGPR